MSTIGVTTYTAVPGKTAEAITVLKEALGLIKGYGGHGHVSSLVRGGVPGTLSLVVEFADAAAYGAAIDRSNSDKHMQEFLTQAQKAPVLAPVRAVDYVEAPGFEVPYSEVASHTVMVATLFKVHHGKQAESLDRVKRSKAITQKHGGKVRVLQSVASDVFGLMATVAYYANFTAWGKAGTALTADADWQALGAEIMGEHASAELLRTSVMRVI
jgi:hypothetical protein